ncbi:3-methyl-2-oxobutanoate hydroxymethyltransferase [Allofranklinella schreckenbergeri]|uniref:3-methyl-2-oxobutanoate hydroxymethyltransferase n=1 Tax=Allofranklinella schreckenbergeri TaxID=1076744 RepID=A0A3M6QU80_9BURK|nr:3-methyl-2-oxobutanoate hydroxymethyltransferase [Allofranklinella schreckenbergeri]
MTTMTPDSSRPVTVPRLRELRDTGHKLTMLTCYDAGFARTLDAAGIDLMLIGDSLGMVVQGAASTLGVTVADIAYHTRCVAAATQRALIVADLPFQADATPERALDAACTLLRAGAGMVKLEGAAGHKLDAIRYLSERDIPVCAHLGLTPQSVLRLGGFKVQGRGDAAAAQLRDDAQAVAAAGAELLVLEAVPSPLAAAITAASPIPTIGIGAGPDCDGQVLVLHDMLGLDSGHRRPRFVQDFLAQGGSIAGAIRAYIEAVQAGRFPAAEHGYAA